MRRVLFAAGALCVLAASSRAQDAVAVAPKHYKVEFENERVRVLRISYAPGEKAPMHEHPAGVVVALTGASVKFVLPGGQTAEATFKPGEVAWTDAAKHQPENVGKQAMEIIQIELKK